MRKVVVLLIALLMIFNITVFAASEPAISFSIDGGTKKGDKLTIYVKVKDADRLYAASVDYIYNPEELKVTYIGGADLISNNDEILELGGETDKDGNRASYQMTFTGKVDGLKASGNLVKIEAEVLKDCNIILKPENMKIKLVNVDTNYNVSNMNFKYESFTTDVNAEKPTDSNNTNTSKPNEGNSNSNSSENREPGREDLTNNEILNNSSNKNNDELSDSSEDELQVASSKGETSQSKEKTDNNNKKVESNRENSIGISTAEDKIKDKSSNKKNGSLYAFASLSILGLGVGGYVYLKKRNRNKK